MGQVICFEAAKRARQLADQPIGMVAAMCGLMPDGAPRPVPAYCDPANERRGTKYDAVESLSVVEIAKRMRADIKALKLAKGFKVAVRCRHGRSINIHVEAVSAGFKFYSEPAAAWAKQFGVDALHRFPGNRDAQMSAEYLAVRAKLDAIHASYNRDNSDLSSDYFDVHFYGSVNFDGVWQALKDEAAASPGNYWAPDCY